MGIAKTVAWICLLAMTGILIFAFATGNFFTEGQNLLAMPWGIVSLVDLYAGFILFSCWIIYREKSVAWSIVWTLLMMVLGFWAGSLYVLIALQTSSGDWKHFWQGGKRVLKKK